MTREEAIRIIRKMLAYTDLSDRANLKADMVDACHLAIKALEREPIIDKIRAEIEQLRPNLRPEQMTDYDYAMVDAVNDIVAILDKYKAESEDKE